MRLVDAELRSLYGLLPAFECKGLCHRFCHTRVACSDRERERVEEAGGRELKREPDGKCSMLDDNGRCVAYQARPMICRLWGMEPTMKCPHGCKPVLTERQAIEFLRRATQIGGGNYTLTR